MSCEKYKDQLPLYVVGEIAHDEAAELKEHIAACPACRSAVDELRGIVGHLTDADAGSLTEAEKLRMENRVYRAMLGRSAHSERLWQGGMSRLTRIAVRVAAVLVIFLFGYASRSWLSGPEQNMPATAEVSDSQLELTRYDRAVVSRIRFSADGLKAIARGKSALLTNLTSEP